MFKNRSIFFFGLAISLFFLSQKISAQNISLVLTQAPCNYDGVLTANLSGFSGPVELKYHFTDNSIITHTTTGTSDILNNYSGGPVWVIATGSGSGNNTAYGSFQGAPPFNFNVNTISAICPAQGSATVVNLSGGAAPFTYQWQDVNANIVGTAATLTAPNGHYKVIVTDANGCKFSNKDSYDSMAVIMNTAPFNFTVNTTPASCTNGTATIGPITGSGVPPYSYLWSNNASSSSIYNLIAGNYTATVTDAQGCASTKYVNISQSPVISVNVTPTPATCTQNDGAVMAFGSGGVPPYTYSWSNGPTTQGQTNLAPRNYSVTVTDANGCTGSTTSQVGSSTPITATYTATASSCTSASGTASLNVSGGQTPYTVNWNTSPQQTGLTVSNLSPGNYGFTITDANGCVRTGTAVIPPVNVLSVSTTIINASCTLSDGSVTVNPLGGSVPYTYLWNNSTTANSITNVPQGSYSVLITDNDGCSITKYATVSSATPIHIGLSSTPASCQFSNDGNIVAMPVGGTAPYTYSWSNGQTTNTASNLTTGNYFVTVTDASGCIASKFSHLTYDPNSNSCYCTITGTVYNDLNGNCIQDPGENGIPNIQIHCSGAGYAYTDANGVYSFTVPSGSYTLSQSVQTIYPLASCQNNSQTVTVTASSGCTQTVDFANTSATIRDINISTWNMTCAVPGNVYTQTMVISNDGTVPENAILAGYIHDGQLNAATFSPSGIFTGGGSNWFSSNSIPVLNPGASVAFDIQYSVPTNIPMNTIVNFRDSASYSSPMSNWLNDYTPWNNINNLNAVIVSSFDPNFKEVIPKGIGEAGFITTEDSVLEFMVHFQNLGTYKAQNIIVLDTLSSNLNWKTLKPIYSSHSGQLTIDESGVLKYEFANINLPAEMYDKEGSNGMFSYSIHLKNNLAPLTEIKNNAAIYFDYNPPIITNTTLNTIELPGSIQPKKHTDWVFQIYPNPTDGNCLISLENPLKSATVAKLTLTDLSGRSLLQKDIKIQSGKQFIPLHLQQLASGIYFVTVSFEQIKSTQKLVLVK